MSDEIAIGHLQKRKIEAGVLIPFITACREITRKDPILARSVVSASVIPSAK